MRLARKQEFTFSYIPPSHISLSIFRIVITSYIRLNTHEKINNFTYTHPFMLPRTHTCIHLLSKSRYMIQSNDDDRFIYTHAPISILSHTHSYIHLRVVLDFSYIIFRPRPFITFHTFIHTWYIQYIQYWFTRLMLLSNCECIKGYIGIFTTDGVPSFIGGWCGCRGGEGYL